MGKSSGDFTLYLREKDIRHEREFRVGQKNCRLRRACGGLKYENRINKYSIQHKKRRTNLILFFGQNFWLLGADIFFVTACSKKLYQSQKIKIYYDFVKHIASMWWQGDRQSRSFFFTRKKKGEGMIIEQSWFFRSFSERVPWPGLEEVWQKKLLFGLLRTVYSHSCFAKTIFFENIT